MCLSVYVSVCLFLTAFPHYCTDPDVTWGNFRGCPLVVHYWADLQSVLGFCCYDNTHVCKLIALRTANAYSAEHKMSANACTRSVVGLLVVWLARHWYQSSVLALRASAKGAKTLSMRSPVADEERMRPGHWLGSLLCVSFSALTLTVG